MERAKEFVKNAGICPRLQVFEKDAKGVPQPTGVHRGHFLAGKEHEQNLTEKDPKTGVPIHKARYTFRASDGKDYWFYVPLYKLDDKHQEIESEPHYLIQRMAEVEPGEEVDIEGKKRAAGSYVEIRKVGGAKPGGDATSAVRKDPFGGASAPPADSDDFPDIGDFPDE